MVINSRVISGVRAAEPVPERSGKYPSAGDADEDHWSLREICLGGDHDWSSDDSLEDRVGAWVRCMLGAVAVPPLPARPGSAEPLVATGEAVSGAPAAASPDEFCALVDGRCNP